MAESVISKIAKAGSAVNVDVNRKPEPAAADTTPAEPATPAEPIKPDTTPDADTNASATAPASVDTPTLPDISDDQLKEILKGKGISFEGDFEAMKNKLTEKPPMPEPTEEEKAAQEAAFEKRMLDFHIKNGGTAEQFVALKQIASMDLKDLSNAEIRKEMKDNGFSQEEIDMVVKERFYQLNPDELVKDEEEEESDFLKKKEFLKKKVAYGSKIFESRSQNTKENAKQSLAELREAVKAEDAARQKEQEFSSKVDEYSKKFPREKTFELGEVDNKKLDPVKISFSEADIAEVAEVLKDKAKRQQYYFNQDNTLNLDLVFENMLLKKSINSIVKAGVLEGGNRQVAEFKKTFPDSPFELGVGGQAQRNNNAGKISKAGKPEFVQKTN